MLVLFVAGVSVLISVLSSGFYYNNSVSLAKDYYSNEQYEKAYDKLSGIKLNGSDKTLMSRFQQLCMFRNNMIHMRII
ncbi:MAG: hypothetical protein ACLS9K_10425 [Lachnospira eligens]